MAHVGEQAKPVEIKDHLKISKGDLNLRLANLVEKRLLYKPARGVYAFSLPLFKEFLLREEKYSVV
ncbi:MAG: hypothetical protein QME81_17670 [bacterium]|nr:hypothetical protein [bacterium]